MGRPRTLQIRLQRVYAGRVRAGAPAPGRSLPTDEVIDNLRFFTAAGPRVLPVDRLVLSGAGGRDDLHAIVGEARARGVTTVTLHADVDDLAATLAAGVDRVVLPLPVGALDRAAPALAACRSAGLAVTANLVLTPDAVPRLGEVTRVALDGGAAAVGFTYPFPGADPGGPLAPLDTTLPALGAAVAAVEAAGAQAWVKGLPACWLGDLARLLTRSTNRWYVDAEHQKGAALMFFPDVVAFFKDDACRFCAADGRCDGFFEAHLRRGGFPALRPVEPAVS